MSFEDNKNKIIHCERCEARCKVAGPRNPDAKMLRRSKSKGLCVNCAVHDWLRNTYPPNILLAQSGPKVLLYPHIQKQFTEIMQTAVADAQPEEINWELIVENWDLPFPHKMKPGPMNPCSQQELDDIKTGKRPGIGYMPPSKPNPVIANNGLITSFDQLNELDPGLGDKLQNLLKRDK